MSTLTVSTSDNVHRLKFLKLLEKGVGGRVRERKCGYDNRALNGHSLIDGNRYRGQKRTRR